MKQTFTALWPIYDTTLPLAHLIRLAQDDLPGLAAGAGARLAGPGRWAVRRSEEVPGSGRITRLVLTYHGPATAAPKRDYRRAHARQNPIKQGEHVT